MTECKVACVYCAISRETCLSDNFPFSNKMDLSSAIRVFEPSGNPNPDGISYGIITVDKTGIAFFNTATVNHVYITAGSICVDSFCLPFIIISNNKDDSSEAHCLHSLSMKTRLHSPIPTPE